MAMEMGVVRVVKLKVSDDRRSTFQGEGDRGGGLSIDGGEFHSTAYMLP